MSDDLLARLQAAESAEERDWLVTEALLESLPAELRQAAWAAAVPHWFDAGILAALLEKPPEACDALHAELQALPFVEPFEVRDGHNVHEVTRTAMLEKLWSEHRDEYRNLSRRAAACFGGSDEAETRIEEIYHLLIADPDAGADALYDQGWEWHNSPNFAYDLVYALAGAALEHAAAGRLDRQGMGAANLLAGTIDTLYSRNQEAMDRLEAAWQASDAGSQLRAGSTYRLGDVHRMLAEYAQARERYEEARALYAATGDRLGEANCIQALGDVHRMVAEYAAARERYEEARPIYAAIGARMGEANCIQALGDVHYMLDEYAAARERYEEARPIYAAIGSRLGEANCLLGLGDVARAEEDWPEAERLFGAALAAYREIGMPYNTGLALRRLGGTAEDKGDRVAAVRYYEEAMEIYERIGVKDAEWLRADLARVRGGSRGLAVSLD